MICQVKHLIQRPAQLKPLSLQTWAHGLLLGLFSSVFSSHGRNRDIFSLAVLSSGDNVLFSFLLFGVCMHTFLHLHVEALSTSGSCNKQCFF